MDIKERSVQSGTENTVDMIDVSEELLAVSSSSPADAAFDAVVGCIEDVIMDEEFHELQLSFMEKHYLEFDNSDENKLNYTLIFKEYVNLLESYLEQQLMERIPDFNMNAFIEQLMQHKDEVSGDIFNMLLSFTDFVAFKDLFLEYRAMKEGRVVDLSSGLVITPLTPAASTHTSSTGSQ